MRLDPTSADQRSTAQILLRFDYASVTVNAFHRIAGINDDLIKLSLPLRL
ncbi:hypothetical protein OAO58_00255 [bacterium]|nr:hypothetical protein [bacterium]